MDTEAPPTLRRTLGLLETTLSGVGIILGAGIYALVGEVAAKAGNTLWVSFLMAAGMAAVIGLAYAELASAYPKAGADYEYTRQALGPRAAFVVGWLIVIGNLVAGAAVALGFGGYLHTFVGVDKTFLALAVLVVATLIAFYGIREAVWTAIVLSLVEAGGLVFIIAIGVPHLGDQDLLEAHRGAAGIFSGAALVMFAFIGFEQVATLAEETVEATRIVPRALLLAIAITTTLYLLVALAAISVLGWQALGASDAPLADVAAKVLGGSASDFLSVVALFSTGNTVLLLIVAASRLIYGMASTRALPRFLAWVHPRAQTPARAIVLCLVVSGGFALSGDIGLVAGATNFAIFIGFAAVNLSLIVLRYSQPEVARPFRLPLNVGRFPLLPVVALGSIAFMMANLERNALLIGAGLFVSGLVAMQALSLWRPLGARGDDPP
ncbi:MAG TPA: APC family permease [Dehalococcoidia bacterium]|nr:APC family permease [Dehalococcoidia bacterium]